MSNPRDLFSRLMYQLAPVSVTTCGPCPTCGDSSRGSGLCSWCLVDELNVAIPSINWGETRRALRESQIKLITAYEAIESSEVNAQQK